jgi:hypothetical protein
LHITTLNFCVIILIMIFFLDNTGVWTQGLAFGRQVLYDLNHSFFIFFFSLNANMSINFIKFYGLFLFWTVYGEYFLAYLHIFTPININRTALCARYGTWYDKTWS